jgi:hypothetical protein
MRAVGALIVSALRSLPAQAREQPAFCMPPGVVRVWLTVLMRGSAWTGGQMPEAERSAQTCAPEPQSARAEALINGGPDRGGERGGA